MTIFCCTGRLWCPPSHVSQSLPVVSSSAVKWSGLRGKNEWSYTSPPSIYLDVGEYVLPRSPHVQPLQVFQHKPLLLVFILLWSSVICHLVWYRCVRCHTVTRFSWQAAATVSAALSPAVRSTGWSLRRRNGSHTIWINALFSEYNQQDAMFLNFFISVKSCTCFRLFFRPSSGAQNYTYSVRYLSVQYCYLLLAWTASSR